MIWAFAIAAVIAPSWFGFSPSIPVASMTCSIVNAAPVQAVPSSYTG
jgi:hypothetical protein